MILHGFFRSSAAYRLRIALNLKGLKAEQISRHLRKGEQRDPDYMELNPQGLVPTLILDDGTVLTQSLAILEWLEETYPEPAILPKDPIERARNRAAALVIAADTHPIQNLKILRRVKALGGDENEWARDVIVDGFTAFEKLISTNTGPYSFGTRISLADICLIPQLANARRFGTDLTPYPRIAQVEQACGALPAFQDAAPENQPDAEA